MNAVQRAPKLTIRHGLDRHAPAVVLAFRSGRRGCPGRALIPATAGPDPDVGLEGVSCLSLSSWTVVG
jgi:hypothetical protein